MSSYKDDPKKEEEPDIVIDNAVPASGPSAPPSGPPVPPGHNRFYCEKCRTVSAVFFSLSTIILCCFIVRSSITSLTYYLRNFLSPMICRKALPRGGVLVVPHSIRLPLPNVPAASFCKDEAQQYAWSSLGHGIQAQRSVWSLTTRSHVTVAPS